MSSIVFVRHAQASLFAADYDQLSELGCRQAVRLREYFRCRGVAFDEWYVGPRKRHMQTAELVTDNSERTGAEQILEISELDEHQVDRLATEHMAQILEEFPEIRPLEEAFRSAQDGIERQQSFARLFEAVARLWVTDRCLHFGIESWDEFSARINGGIGRILDRGGRGRNVIVFTSAGAIVAAMQRALNCSSETALGLGWRIWNCSLTQFVFSGDRFSLDQFNTVPHLNERSEWTYR